VYNDFLDFYHENIYDKDYSLGVFYEGIIWTHLFLPPIGAILFLLYRERGHSYGKTDAKIYCAGFSFRKWMIWLSAIPTCGVEIILFLWSFESWIIIFTLIIHTLLLFWGLLLLWMLAEMRGHHIVRKYIGDLGIDPAVAKAAVTQYVGKLQKTFPSAQVAVSIMPDNQPNRDAYMGEIRYPGISGGGVTIDPGRINIGGATESEIESKLYCGLASKWMQIPSFSSTYYDVQHGSVSGVTVLTENYDNPGAYVMQTPG